ncbi:hypothetical protein V1478_010446 [Vespula squamosa]|uniref:Uncharacterized protein n=1 Tax=Vespula squamosa TaxID=30214 RepID=A0ABD2AI22_VESSQ
MGKSYWTVTAIIDRQSDRNRRSCGMSFVNCDRRDYFFLRISIIRPSWYVFNFFGTSFKFSHLLLPIPIETISFRLCVLSAAYSGFSKVVIWFCLILGPNVHQVLTPQTRVEHLTSIRSKSTESKFRVLIGFRSEADPIQSALS